MAKGANKPRRAPRNPIPGVRRATTERLKARYLTHKPLKGAKLEHKLAEKKAEAPLRKSLQPGTVIIVLAGRFRGSRVVYLKQLASGLLLVTGPYDVNGCPLRRVNQAYVIATSTRVDISTLDVKGIDDAFFQRKKKVQRKKQGDFFEKKDDEKEKDKDADPQWKARVEMQKKVDAALLPLIAKTPNLRQFLAAKFTLTKGQYPHLMKF